MDFLKTLLLYMTLMTTLSVQEGPLPQDVPTPSPLPPSVTATLAPFQTEAPTATPTATPAPVPTITPNTRYTTLRYQDRGNDVRKLQRKLIELGYMPDGSDDGAYGYQTYNAVRDFQLANGLSADGVAGPTTLTNLYENPDIIPYIVPTVPPTATPTATLPPLPTMTAPPAGVQTGDAVETIAPPVDAAVNTAAAVPGLTEVSDALIISGLTGEPLALTETIDGVAVRIRPHLWENEMGEAVMSLRELVDCMPGWTLMGSSADGVYRLNAAGYAVEIQCGAVLSVTVDGAPVQVDMDDVKLSGSTVYITADFLEAALSATTIYDAEEQSLVLFMMDKTVNQAND
ncbi:MAG: peptidoglycan-binding protein [Clostridia bacterium]|nr:peptidoglycan-binding protein [Clostridia bacterium]